VLKYQIRPAVPADLEVILHHRRRMFEDMGSTDSDGLDAMIKNSIPILKRGLSDGSYRAWLVTAGEVVVAGGGIIFHESQPNPQDPKPQRAWVVNLFTEKEHRRQGLARLLMQTMLEWCRHRGMRFLYLHASDQGRPLYENLGFEANNEMRLTL
jgi:GNAT superfamily N-acetyltransferase